MRAYYFGNDVHRSTSASYTTHTLFMKDLFLLPILVLLLSTLNWWREHEPDCFLKKYLFRQGVPVLVLYSCFRENTTYSSRRPFLPEQFNGIFNVLY
jgi:hypothetical protein